MCSRVSAFFSTRQIGGTAVPLHLERVAAIAAHHSTVKSKSLGKHDLITRFLRGARRLDPPRP